MSSLKHNIFIAALEYVADSFNDSSWFSIKVKFQKVKTRITPYGYGVHIVTDDEQSLRVFIDEYSGMDKAQREDYIFKLERGEVLEFCSCPLFRMILDSNLNF